MRRYTMITLYTIDCPKCKVLEMKLNQKGINYDVVKDIEKMKELGITTAPVLKIEDGKLLMFTDAVRYINEM
jgi:glutaredoxin